MLPHQPHTNSNLVQILKQLCPLDNIKLYVLYSQMFSMSCTTPDSLDHLSRSVGVISVKEELQTESVELLARGPNCQVSLSSFLSQSGSSSLLNSPNLNQHRSLLQEAFSCASSSSVLHNNQAYSLNCHQNSCTCLQLFDIRQLSVI